MEEMTEMTTTAQRTLWITLLLSTALGLTTSGCAESQETVDVVVHHAMSVDFGQMEADIPEQAVIPLPDLREEPDYQAYQSRLVCGSLLYDASWMQLTALDTTAVNTTLALELQVRRRGSDTNWYPLVNFAGSLAAGDVITLDGPGIAHFPQGETVLIDAALSAQPAYDLRIVGETAEDLDSLRLGLELEITFSTVLSGCP